MNTFENSTKKSITFALLLFVMFTISFVMNWRILKPKIMISAQEEKITIDKNIVDILSAGNRRFISSIYWVETLMNSDIEHYQKNDLGNWMYNRFDTISLLDPEFYENYLLGGIYLSIVKDDEVGAKRIYEKGLLKFPNDIDLLYNAGFNDYFELNLEKDAIEKFSKLANSKEGINKYPFIISLGEKLKRHEGSSLEETYKVMLDVYNRAEKNSFVRSFYSKTLYGLKAEIDLTCLNAQAQNCSKIDFDGNPYRFSKTDNQYFANKAWKRFKIRKKLEN